MTKAAHAREQGDTEGTMNTNEQLANATYDEATGLGLDPDTGAA